MLKSLVKVLIKLGGHCVTNKTIVSHQPHILKRLKIKVISTQKLVNKDSQLLGRFKRVQNKTYNLYACLPNDD